MEIDTKNQHILTIEDDKLKSEDLFCYSKEIVILHGSEKYKLRLTINNKLILTK